MYKIHKSVKTIIVNYSERIIEMKKTDDETKFIKSKKTKFAEFISKNSVYGIFAVVLIAICAITILSLPHSDPDNPAPAPSEAAEAIPTEKPHNSDKPNPTQKPNNPATPTPGKVAENTPAPVPTPTPGSTDVDSQPKNEFSVVLPFAGQTVITKYSNEEAVYSDTLNEWSCHVGLDFSCNKGDAVPVAANGIVVSITEDDIYGTSVLVKHTGEFYTLYRGLEKASVKKDELIAQGQSLGTVAETLPFEAHMPTHIHFEVIKDSLSVNPYSFAK